MGKSSTAIQHFQTVSWAEQLTIKPISLVKPISPSALATEFDYHLKNYFRLCGLARSKTANRELAARAHKRLFSSRVAIERSVIASIDMCRENWGEKISALSKCSVYGVSKKQGISMRMPLTTCAPTKLCAAACYAHDVLDASPNAVVRGAINGWLANSYEIGNETRRSFILGSLERHTRVAVRHAQRELLNLPDGFIRRGYIRFSHVGEMAAFPNFANAMAVQVKQLSKGCVDCVIYTRLRQASALNSDLWVVNFTLDPSSLDRGTWAPSHSRIVFSAFGGEVSPLASVNFLEHHRHTHTRITKGEGNICPATSPDVMERTCDACRCKTCFEKPLV